MSNFDRHLEVGKRYAVVVGIVTLFIGLDAGLETTTAVVAAVITTTLFLVSALIPDVDHQSSIPRQRAGLIMTAALWIGIVALLIIEPKIVGRVGRVVGDVADLHLEPKVLGVLTIVGIAYGVQQVGSDVFDSATTHRGMMHSPLIFPALFVVFYVILHLLGTNPNIHALLLTDFEWLIPAAGASGVFVHLIEDSN